MEIYISSSAGLSKQYALKHLHSTYCSLNECLRRKKGSQEQFPKASQEITKNYLKQTNSSTAIKTHSSPNLKNFFGFFKGTKISFFLIFNRSWFFFTSSTFSMNLSFIFILTRKFHKTLAHLYLSLFSCIFFVGINAAAVCHDGQFSKKKPHHP